jgi:hypothetical protein
MTNITKPFSPATSKRIALAMLAVGALLLVFACYLFITQWEFSNRSIKATGVAKALNPPEIVFKTRDGDLITFKHDGWRSGSHPSEIGESVLVAYLPEAPARAEIEDFIWLEPCITLFWGINLLLFGYLTYIEKMVIGPLRQKRFIIGAD